jgi:hypothetical protein
MDDLLRGSVTYRWHLDETRERGADVIDTLEGLCLCMVDGDMRLDGSGQMVDS